MKVFIAQIGAREHYAAARALYRQGMLAGLATDWYAFAQSAIQGREKCLFQRFNVSTFRFLGSKVKSALSARCDEIPDELVYSFPWRSLWWKWKIKRAARHGRLYDGYRQADAAFARAASRLRLPKHDVFFGYSYASLEMLEAEKRQGVMTVLDQIDPGAAEFQLVAEEMERHPEVAGLPPKFPVANFDRNRREWELTDVIVVNSEWSRELLVQQGADAAKIEILPLAFDAPLSGPVVSSQLSRGSPDRPLRVLWLGQVNVRKGIHYLIEAASLLQQEEVEFVVAGQQQIRREYMAAAPANIRWLGQIPRGQVPQLYQNADLFVLPTLSDGFAITQIEAMAYGVPVIATPNCGHVVENGKTGFVVPPRDPQALAEAILKFVHNPNISASIASACHAASKEYSLEAYGKRLAEIIKKRISPNGCRN